LVSCEPEYNCKLLRKAGFRNQNSEENLGNTEEDNDAEVDNEEGLRLFTSAEENSPVPSFIDFVAVDDNVMVTEDQTEDDIVDPVRNDSSGNIESEDEESSPEIMQPLVKKKDAVLALQTLTNFFEQNDCDQDVFEKVFILEKKVDLVQTEKQKKMTEFF